MFLHEFVYELKRVLRQKEELFWVLLFPMILGTMFHFAFSNLSNSTEIFHTIPVAVCADEKKENQAFFQVLDALSQTEDTPFLSVTRTDWETAKQLLKDNSVRGIFFAEENVTLTCTSSDSSDANSTLAIEQSILEAFLKEFLTNHTAVTEIVSQNPEKMNDILSLMDNRNVYGKQLTLTESNLDNVVQYFFNLIAMACLFTSFPALQIALKNQANLSALGARKSISPSSKAISVAAQLLSCILSQFFCLTVNVLYLFYILKVDFQTSLSMILFTSFIGCIMGVSFGYFIGAIGQLSEGTKTGILICTSMLCCFLSGLMIDTMRSIVESICPFINVINPAVRISDSFLTLSIYGINERYFQNLFALLLISVIFISAGCLMIRRKTYASL